MCSFQQLFILLVLHLLFCPIIYATLSFPSFDWFSTPKKHFKKVNRGQQNVEVPNEIDSKDSSFFPREDNEKGQETQDFTFLRKPDHSKGQEIEEFHFGQKPEGHKGQEIEEINFGSKPEHPKGQEIEEFHFGPKENYKGQEIEEINFGSKPEQPKGQEIEEINFGSKPEHPKGQEVEEFHFRPKDNYKGQEVEEINFGSKSKELKENFETKPEDSNSEKGNSFDVFLPSSVKKNNCKDKPEASVNMIINCESLSKCEATCDQGYKFLDNRKKLIFECEDNKWITPEHGDIKPECEPECMPSCQNNGVCVAPNQCECPKNFEGPQCQFGQQPCLNHPPVSQNSEIHCNASNCTIKCFYTYAFPDGSTTANLICHQGQWTLERNDWNTLPDCQPSCHPPCINGGSCLDFNKCECPRQYAGPQCQYEIAACDGQKLNFNGIYTCRGESDKVICNLSCPKDYTPNVPLANEYICLYSTGRFLPEPIPKCVYGNDVEVTKFASSSHKIYKGLENFESSKTGLFSFQKNFGECVTWKNFHYKTFDGEIFSFDGKCSYILAQDSKNTFRIIIDNSNCHSSICTRSLKIFYQDKEYDLSYKNGIPNLAINELVQTIPIQLHGFSVEQKENQILVFLELVDVNLVWDNEDHLSIKVNQNLWNKTAGLCGNFNSNPRDDFETSEGAPAYTVELFVRSWVNDLYNCELYPYIENSCKDNSDENFCHRIFTNSHFEKCYNIPSLKSYENACLWDVCKCGKTCTCSTISEFVRNCKEYLLSQDFPDTTSDWRQIADCPMNCPPGKIYSFCGPSVQATCGTYKSTESLAKLSTCVEGCFCPEGMVLLNGTCIRKENCPCQWRNKNYGNDEKITKGCNTCTCQNGEWVCTNLKCESRCSLTGGSHYLTFDGKRYDFMGKCSYYLLKSKNFTIESENSPCSGDVEDFREIFSSPISEYSSCTKSITIRYGKDEIKLKKHKEILFNGAEVSSLPINKNGVIIRLGSSNYLRLTLLHSIDVWWDGVTNVYIDLPGTFEDPIGGLCGSFNNNQKDDFLTPEGDVEQSAIAFAEKWKTDESCSESLNPLKPHPCVSNINHKILAEKYCHKLKDNIFKNCHSYVDVEPFYKNCIYDVCSCQKDLKSCFCPIFTDYGNECTMHNVEVPWRNEIRECGLHCGPGQIYEPCGDSCTRTCQDISINGGHYCSKKCVEGCNCPEGLTLNSLGQCIPVSECPCTHQSLEYKPNHQMIMESNNGPQFCTCENADWSCRPATKLEIDRDYENSNVKCNETMHEEYTTCEPAEPKTCKNMHEIPKHSTRICFPGCVCKKGFVWDSIGKICVNASECPCHHGGKSYADEEKIQEDCNTCTCKNGLWSCTERECSAICSTWGDSHFKTFDGHIYDFQGSCEFVLTTGSVSEYDTFVVTLQIIPCGSTGISCPKSVTLKVGSKNKEEEIVFRKSNPSSIPKNLERIAVREAGLFIFAEVFDLGITVQWDRGTRINVKVDPKWKNRVKGLCGNFNNNELDDFKTPSSGETSEISPVLFADSWRLQTYCPESLPITDTCSYRPNRKAWAVEKCSIIKSEVFEPCHSEVPFEPYLERCTLDACGCDEGGDCECMCTAISAYAEECTLRGIPIKWRTQNLCGLQCESKDSQYSPCISTCPPKSCDNQFQHSALLQTCSQESCVEGCDKPQCPPGHVIADSSSNRCIPLSSCKTVCLTVNNVTYLEGDLMESDDCHSCFCSHHKKTCTGKPCSEILESTTHLFSEIPETTIPGVFITSPTATTSSVCPPGQIWDDCIVTCTHVCNHLEEKIRNHSQCLSKEDCVSGCKAVDLNCPFGMFLRDENTCVHKKDCPCLSETKSVVKPGDVVQESECEKCQCINNEYECTSICSSVSYTTHPTVNFTHMRHSVTSGMDFGHEGNVTLLRHSTATTLSSLFCPNGQYETLIDKFAKFSASSHADEFSLPEQGQINASTGWIAAFDNADQYLQVDLGRVEPIYAVNVAGASGKYVTGYHLLHSLNGHKFDDIINQDGKKEIFGGPFDGYHSVNQVLPNPIEARYVRFHPVSWHEGIAMKVDVLGCSDFFLSTTTYQTTTTFSKCNKPIGIGQKHFPKLHITATSSKPNTGPDFIGFDNEKGWQPLTNSKSEWVQLDFGEFINFTGIITKGVSQSNDLIFPMEKDSWVERYKVEYSHDGLTWNPILDEFGNEMTFMGNTDSDTDKKNSFKRPIRAKALKILPIKWHHNIALRLDVMGCYESPVFELEVTPPIGITKTDCNLCEGALPENDQCKCDSDKWWDGEKCVVHSECPCFIGLISYPVGTTFTTEKCEECICRLYGVPHCTPKLCEDCPHGLQKVLTPLCGCTCKPCEEGSRLCPTSNICLNESEWCDGVQDCPDDELNCTTPILPDKVTPTPKPCNASCPPGYDIVYRKKTPGPSEADDMLQNQLKTKSIKSKKSIKTYKKSKKSRKHIKPEKLTECPPYDCVPIEEVTATACPPPECPLDYSVAYKKSVKHLEGACPLYTCEPIPEFANCSVSSRNIKTFDGSEYKYEICDHILARDNSGSWNVTMFKTCVFNSPCVSSLLINHGAHSIELHPHDRIIKYDSFNYSYSQVELLNSKIGEFILTPIGDSIIFTSEMYGFAVVHEANGNVRITVPSQMKDHVNGLCGLYNDHPFDDKTLPNGKLAKTTVDFGDSWSNPGGKECIESVCPIEKQNMALEICNILRNEPFASCSKGINLEVCIENTCDCLKSNKTEDECRCLTLSDFAAKCKNPDLFGWRVEHDCPSSCPPNLVHYDCYPYACEPTCGNEECAEPATDCYSGCFCPDGLVKKNDQCIKLQECRDCICSGMGDSTYLTFDGAMTFNGNCSYIASREKNPAGTPGFEIFITNSLCNGSDFMTCTAKVEVKVPGHSITLAARPDIEEKVLIFVDEHVRNREELNKLTESWSKIYLNPEVSSVHVDLPNEHVEVRYFYNRYAFTISLPSHYYSDKVEGLCGTCSRNENPEETENPEVWQIEKDENCLIEPPTECIPTPEHEKICLQMKDYKIFGQCLNFVDPSPFIDQCLAALCSNGHVCHSLEAYSQACRDAGICVDWRSEEFCPFTCPSDLEYHACKSGCLKTCENYEETTSCTQPPLEGCFCPNDQVLINGTCKSQKYCDYCDEDGQHYEDELWQVDKCTNCTCKDRTVTCNKVECPLIDLTCDKDQVPIKEENDNECCPKFKCGCKPQEECSKVELPNEILPTGMVAVINETGCCPHLEIVCQKDTCPEPKVCKNFYIQKIIGTTECCPQHICEKPENKCIYEFENVHSEEDNSRVNRESAKEVIKDIGERWADGPCKNCLCLDKNGMAEAVCMVTECSLLEDHQDFKDYELSHIHNPEKCCPEVIRKNCKDNDTIYQVGDSWMPDEKNPCETMKCNILENGQILKETRMEICNTECDQGWEYKRSEEHCCGHCVQTGCVAEDKLYKDGEIWFSEDHCFKSTCMKKNGVFVISTMTESCPSLEDCPEEDIYQDKCCLRCKIRAESKKICTPHPLSAENTVKLIRENKSKHGLCHNLNPVENFTECAGNCDSYTVYKPETWSHESVCKCCQPEEFSIITVELTCEDGMQVMKSITVPSKCSCMPCSG